MAAVAMRAASAEVGVAMARPQRVAARTVPGLKAVVRPAARRVVKGAVRVAMKVAVKVAVTSEARAAATVGAKVAARSVLWKPTVLSKQTS